MISSSFYKFAATTKVAFTSKHRFNWLISGAVRRPLRSSRSIDKTDHVTVQFVVFRNQGQVTNGWPLPGQICFRSHTISSFRTAAQTPFVSKWPAGCRRVINLNYQNRTNQVNKMLLRKRVRIVFGKLKFQLEKLYWEIALKFVIEILVNKNINFCSNRVSKIESIKFFSQPTGFCSSVQWLQAVGFRKKRPIEGSALFDRNGRVEIQKSSSKLKLCQCE